MGLGREGPFPVNKPAGLGLAFFLLAVSSAAVAEELDDLKLDVQAGQKVLEEMKASRERMEKSAALAAHAIELLKAEKYSEAEQALTEWEAVDPEDSRLPALKELTSKLKAEPDPARQSDLWADYLDKTMKELQPKENFVHRDS